MVCKRYTSLVENIAYISCMACIVCMTSWPAWLALPACWCRVPSLPGSWELQTNPLPWGSHHFLCSLLSVTSPQTHTHTEKLSVLLSRHWNTRQNVGCPFTARGQRAFVNFILLSRVYWMNSNRHRFTSAENPPTECLSVWDKGRPPTDLKKKRKTPFDHEQWSHTLISDSIWHWCITFHTRCWVPLRKSQPNKRMTRYSPRGDSFCMS